MRIRKAIAVAAAILLAAPAAAPAQAPRDDERVRQAAAALPERLWEPGPEPVSAAGPGVPEQDGVAPVLAVVLMLGAVGAGYAAGAMIATPARRAGL
jgi:hypothetical protein